MLRAAFALVAVCLGLSLVAAQQPAPAQAVTMDDIKKAWQERQDKVKTLKMSWTQKITHPKGSLTARARASIGKVPSEVQPPKDLQIDGACEFVLSEDGRYSLEIKKSNWSVEKQSLRPFHTRMMFDGKDHHVEFLATDKLDHKAVVSSQPQKVTGELRTISTYPIFWMFRGLDGKFSHNLLDEYELSGRMVTLQGKRCCELVQVSRTTNSKRSLYLDTERSFLPLALSVTIENVPTLQLDIEYRLASNGMWEPSSWKSATYAAAGQLRESVVVAVTQCATNPVVSDNEFQPKLAPGTHLIDQRDSNSRTQTVVKEDGTVGRQFPLQTSLTYEELREESARSAWTWRHTLICLAAGIFVVFAGYAIVAHRRRNYNRNLHAN